MDIPSMVSGVARALKKACFLLYARETAMHGCCAAVRRRSSLVSFVANIEINGDAGVRAGG
jgi:hypothetical protein